jgi:hypothetical protein
MDPCKFLHMNLKELGLFCFLWTPMSWVTIFNHLWKLAWFKSRSWGSWPNLPTRSLRIRTVLYTDSKIWWHICNFVVLNTFKVCKLLRIWCQIFFLLQPVQVHVWSDSSEFEGIYIYCSGNWSCDYKIRVFGAAVCAGPSLKSFSVYF